MNHRLTKAGKLDGRTFNGGARKGAGRPISKERQAWIDFALETIVVKEFRHGQIRRVKKMRLEVIMEKLFHLAIEGNVRAIHVYLDRTEGKAVTPKPEANELPVKDPTRYSVDEILVLAYGDPAVHILPSRSIKEGTEIDELIESIEEATDAISKGTFLPTTPLE